MSTVTISHDAAPVAAAGRTRSAVGALAGLAFAICFFVGVASLELPEHASDAELVAWWSDSGNRTTAIVSMYLFVVAGLCFLGFLAVLVARLREREGGTAELTVVLTSGVVFVAMLFVAAVARGVIGFAVESPASDESLPGPDTLRYVPQVGYAATGTGGMLAAALLMATVSVLVARTRAFGSWLAWIGGAAALLTVAASVALSGVFAIPAVLVWALAASVALWRGVRG
jgi:hypothetical protein